jgi:hypothetical protein
MFYLLSQTICGKLNGINPFYLSTKYFIEYFYINLNLVPAGLEKKKNEL